MGAKKGEKVAVVSFSRAQRQVNGTMRLSIANDRNWRPKTRKTRTHTRTSRNASAIGVSVRLLMSFLSTCEIWTYALDLNNVNSRYDLPFCECKYISSTSTCCCALLFAPAWDYHPRDWTCTSITDSIYIVDVSLQTDISVECIPFELSLTFSGMSLIIGQTMRQQ